MIVQNISHQISAHPDLTSQLLQILIPTIWCQKGDLLVIESFACRIDKLDMSWLSPWFTRWRSSPKTWFYDEKLLE